MESKFFNNTEENDETDNYITCPLLQLKFARQRKPITRYVNILKYKIYAFADT
jgi:hypothetical protein